MEKVPHIPNILGGDEVREMCRNLRRESLVISRKVRRRTPDKQDLSREINIRCWNTEDQAPAKRAQYTGVKITVSVMFCSRGELNRTTAISPLVGSSSGGREGGVTWGRVNDGD